MMQLRKILAPVDFSENSNAAVKYACEIAQQFNTELHLLHVVDNLGTYAIEMEMVGGAQVAYDVIEAEKSAVKMLEELPGHKSGTGRIVRVTEIGPPCPGIKKYATEQDIDLIVISTHGRTGLSHLLMGSVAENIVRIAPCPVLTVKPEGHQFIHPGQQVESQPA